MLYSIHRQNGEIIINENLKRYFEYSKANLAQLKMMNIGKESVFANISIFVEPHFAVFSEMFLDVRDRFISSSEYGLNFYLSLRIRHGTLQGQIRNTFENLNLISTRDSVSGNYIQNIYWENKALDLSSEKRVQIQNLLSNFSKEIDSLTDNLKKIRLQIKNDTKNSPGMFDYSFNETVLLKMFIHKFNSLSQEKDVLNGVFAILWERTEENLIKIRAYIENELKGKIHDKLSELHVNIKEVVGEGKLPELFTNITMCKTKIQHEFDKLAAWFKISGTNNYPSTILFKNLIQVCVAHINRIHSQAQITPLIKADNISLKGEYLNQFLDIINILLENIIKHSGLSPDKYQVEIELKKEGSNLIIVVRNAISPVTRAKDPVKTLELRKQNYISGKSSNKLSSEGGTGICKICKLMKIDLSREFTDISFSYQKKDKLSVCLKIESEGLINENSPN